MNRKYHSLTGHYNVFFNGEQKLLDAIKQIEASHTDDFTKTLEVNKSGTPEAAKSAGNLLDEALKKFSATIQMHKIGSYTDDAYFNIAKTRYYKQDYYTAIETFQYILGNYKNGPFENASKAWIAKCYVGLKKVSEAEAILGQLLIIKSFDKEDQAFIYSTAADIDIKTDKPQAAIDHLKLALKGKLSKDDKIRYNYILGQLSIPQKKQPEATYFFNRVIKYVPPYDFAFNANLALMQLYDVKNPKALASVKKNLKRMSRDDKNIDYLDQIWYETGKVDLITKNESEAINDFKKSAAFSTRNKNQKALAYLELAKIYFAQKNYKSAQAYYDSTVATLDPNHKDYNTLKNTKVVLSDLINNIVVFETEDSLQRLSQLSKDALLRKVDAWIAENNKKKLADEKEAKKRAKLQASLATNPGLLAPAAPVAGGGSSEWYFYNPNLVSGGSAEFFSLKKWGQRKNEDYWRIAAKEKVNIDTDTASATSASAKKENPAGKEITAESNAENLEKGKVASITGVKEKDAWIKNVPLTPEQKERSNARMLEALHNLGVIYYDQLANPNECIKYTEKLQDKYPLSEYDAPSLFYLFKAYADIKNTTKSDLNKRQLIELYPNSNYALLAQNKRPVNAEKEVDKQLTVAYEKMYEYYTSKQYLQAMEQKNLMDKNYPGNLLKPKYDLLNAHCIGKTQDKAAYEKALQEIAIIHKGTEPGNTAEDYLKILKQVDKKTAFKGKDSSTQELEFDLETETPHYYLLGIKATKVDINEINTQFNNYNEAYMSNNNLRVNSYLSNEGYQLIVVREFTNQKNALNYYSDLKTLKFTSTKLQLKDPYVEYVISGTNFKKILKDKKVEQFETFFKKQLQLTSQVK